MWRFVCGVADAVSLVVQQRRSRSGASYIVFDYVSTVLTCFSVLCESVSEKRPW